ncbi:MAG: CBS domain-containing protein [Alphaproteobacteria bacterium]|nr:CBS domain-containing protein [Alphaproteobacteria bacterium]
MTIAAILKHKGDDVTTIAPTATVAEVAAVLAEQRIGALPVVDRADQLLGIISERDVIRALAANGPAALQMLAGQLMTRTLRVATRSTTVEQAMTLMTASRFRHLPVIEGGVLVGIVSIGDVVKARILQTEHEVDSLKAYVAGVA